MLGFFSLRTVSERGDGSKWGRMFELENSMGTLLTAEAAALGRPLPRQVDRRLPEGQCTLQIPPGLGANRAVLHPPAPRFLENRVSAMLILVPF